MHDRACHRGEPARGRSWRTRVDNVGSGWKPTPTIDEVFASAQAALADVPDGDLASWHTGAGDAIPALGGAMDLAIGANKTLVTMERRAKAGESKPVARCSCPLTGLGCVSRVCTDLAVIDVTPAGMAVVGPCDGRDLAQLQAMTAEPLHMA